MKYLTSVAIATAVFANGSNAILTGLLGGLGDHVGLGLEGLGGLGGHGGFGGQGGFSGKGGFGAEGGFGGKGGFTGEGGHGGFSGEGFGGHSSIGVEGFGGKGTKGSFGGDSGFGGKGGFSGENRGGFVSDIRFGGKGEYGYSDDRYAGHGTDVGFRSKGEFSGDNGFRTREGFDGRAGRVGQWNGGDRGSRNIRDGDRQKNGWVWTKSNLGQGYVWVGDSKGSRIADPQYYTGDRYSSREFGGKRSTATDYNPRDRRVYTNIGYYDIPADRDDGWGDRWDNRRGDGQYGRRTRGEFNDADHVHTADCDD